MQVKIAALADYASISMEKKLSIMGIFSQLNTREVPCTYPQMAIVVQFEFTPNEAGTTKGFGVELVDEDGTVCFSLSGKGAVPESKDAEPVVLNQILMLQNMVFPRFGRFEFKVLLDGEPVTSLPIQVLMIPSQAGQMGV